MSNDFKDLFGDFRPEDSEEKRSNLDPGEPENRGRRALNEKEVKVVNVYEDVYESSRAGNSRPNTTFFVLLRDKQGRKFRIFVLRDIAYSISMAIESSTPDRPFTHDLMRTIMERTGASVERVIIDDLWNDTFYAKIGLVQNGDYQEIDARSSDAIALALRFHAPIYVAEWVIEAAKIDSDRSE